jgi:DNA-directed RNA polymerase subunit RPC12/RpoP
VVFEYWTYKCPTCGTSADFEREYEDDGYDG